MELGGEIAIGRIMWIKRNQVNNSIVDVVTDNSMGELTLQLTNQQIKALKPMLHEFCETGQLVRDENFPINVAAGFKVFTSLGGKPVSFSLETEVPESEFDEDASYCLDFKDPQERCSSIVVDIEQARKIRYLLDKLIEKHDLFVTTKKELIRRSVV